MPSIERTIYNEIYLFKARKWQSLHLIINVSSQEDNDSEVPICQGGGGERGGGQNSLLHTQMNTKQDRTSILINFLQPST